MGKIIENRFVKDALSSFLAGIIMALASFELIVFKSEDYYFFGAFIQGFGLLTVLALNLELFSNNLIKFFKEKKTLESFLDILITFVVNSVTVIGFSHLFKLMSNSNQNLINAAIEIANKRLIDIGASVGKEWYMSLISSFFCGVIVNVGITLYKKYKNPFVRIFSVLLLVGLYVCLGFENFLTNLGYISFASYWSLSTFTNVCIVVIGNFLGSLMVYLILNTVLKVNDSKPIETNTTNNNEQK